MCQVANNLSLTARRYNLVGVTRRRTGSLYFSQKVVTVQALPAMPAGRQAAGMEVMTHFLPSLSLRSFSEGGRVQILEYYVRRGTSLIEAG